MSISPMLMLHVCSATVGLLSGYLALGLRKGSGLHRAAGTVFFVSMVSMTTSATYLAIFVKPIMLNVVAALLTLYLVVTARSAGRRKDDAGTGPFDWGALLLASGVGLFGIGCGLRAIGPTGMKDGMPVAMYFIFGTIALLFASSDVRMLRRGGIEGKKRIARHVLRMGLALLISTMSFFPGQARLFPRWLRDTNLLVLPHLLLIGVTAFWLVRLLAKRRARRARLEEPPRVPSYALGVD